MAQNYLFIAILCAKCLVCNRPKGDLLFNFRRVFNIHTELEELPSQLQLEMIGNNRCLFHPSCDKKKLDHLWKISIFLTLLNGLTFCTKLILGIDLSLPGLALLIARSENCRNGLEQAQEGVGELDEVKWKVSILKNPKD